MISDGTMTGPVATGLGNTSNRHFCAEPDDSVVRLGMAISKSSEMSCTSLLIIPVLTSTVN